MLSPIAAINNTLERVHILRLENKFGKQIGKMAENGNMTFQKKIGNKTVTTGVHHNGKPIAQVIYEGDVMGKKISYNADGDIIETSHLRRANKYRKNVKENLETGEVNSRTFYVNSHGQFVVNHTKLDKYGSVISQTTPVRIDEKSSSLG